MKAWAAPIPKLEPQPAPVVIVPPPGPIFFRVMPVPSLVTVAAIQKAACAHFGLDRAALLMRRQTADVAYPRHIAMYAASQYTRLSFPAIGRHFGGRDH